MSPDLSYEVIIGCEIHCQLMTNTKAFCSCSPWAPPQALQGAG